MKSSKDPGCPYVVGETKRFNRLINGWETVLTHCLKIPSETSEFCPKHEFIAAHEKEIKMRQSDKAIVSRNLNTKKQEELKNSPLRAESLGGYEQ